MIYKALVVAALFVMTVVILVVLWRKTYKVSKPRQLQGERLPDIQHLLIELGFGHQTTRHCLGTSILHASTNHEPSNFELEFGDGLYNDYTRIIYTFDESLCQGIHILCEDRLGLTGTFLKFREMTLGEPKIDDAFVLMAQDTERMQLLFRYRPIRRALMALKLISNDIVLSDTQLFVYVESLPDDETLRSLLKHVAAIVESITVFSKHYGPINAAEKRSYTELLENMNLRDEMDLDMDVPDELSASHATKSSPKGMDDVTEMIKADMEEDAADQTPAVLDSDMDDSVESMLDEDEQLDDDYISAHPTSLIAGEPLNKAASEDVEDNKQANTTSTPEGS